jgi:transposase-like protein
VVLETEQPGATVSSVARRRDIVPSMLLDEGRSSGSPRRARAVCRCQYDRKRREERFNRGSSVRLLMAPGGMTLVDLPESRRGLCACRRRLRCSLVASGQSQPSPKARYLSGQKACWRENGLKIHLTGLIHYSWL